MSADPNAWREQRPTPSQRLHEVTMAALARRPAEPEHTVGLTLNAKGDVQIEVTGRGPDLALLTQDVAVTFDELRARYPRAESEPAEKSQATKANREAAAAAAIARAR